MISSVSSHSLTLSGLAHRCAEETERFFRRQDYDSAPCYELFRRATAARDEAAFAVVYSQYRGLVRRWVEQHPAFVGDEEADFFVNRAFEKFWHAVTPEKFARFPHLKAVLAYLKLCVHSVLVDHARSRGPQAIDQEPEQLELHDWRSEADPLASAVASLERSELWRLVLSKLQDDRERIVIHGSFVLALKPREIQAQHPNLFASVGEIYRTKQNVLERLRRDKDLHALLR
ncbi:MAG: hypothetical protein NZ528_08375 [Caldilineales bacterium]|nr:hypothetical protein [Caldilineales bacterium]